MPNPQGSFTYVYILTSTTNPDHHYTGLTDNLSSRLASHNAGQCQHTSCHRPWQIETAISFKSRDKAATFEKYLKTGSGRAFARRHF